MEAIDRKFMITAYRTEDKLKAPPSTIHNEYDSVLFLAKDICLPPLLDAYYDIAKAKGAGPRQLEGIKLLQWRVVRWQFLNPDRVKIPDVEKGPAGDHIVKPNE